MKTHVQKWGNSLAVRIPKSVAIELGLSAESPVELSVDAGAITLRPSKPTRPTLAELLARITPENRHEEVIPTIVGREVW